MLLRQEVTYGKEVHVRLLWIDLPPVTAPLICTVFQARLLTPSEGQDGEAGNPEAGEQ